MCVCERRGGGERDSIERKITHSVMLNKIIDRVKTDMVYEVVLCTASF